MSVNRFEMGQASLPDLNTLWLKWTDVCNNCLRQKDFKGAIAAVFHIIAVFGDENRVEINTPKYIQLTYEHLKVKCSSCHAELFRDDIDIRKLNTSFSVRVLTGIREISIWYCSQCKERNNLSETEFIQEKFKNPRYLGVIPEPPERKRGMVGLKDFENDTGNWVRLALDEVSNALGIERRTYVSKLDRDDMLDADDD